MMDTGHMPIRDCSDETYKLRASLQAIDHIGSGGTAAVVRGFVDGEAPQDLALKLLDPRRVTTDDREREYRKFEHANLVRIDELTNLCDLGFAHVPDWYINILDCQPEPFVSHPVAICSPNPCNWRQRRGINDKTLGEFGPAEFFMLIMEYCPVTLSGHIRHSRSMGEIHRILIEVCAGLTAMHREGITHTDLSIENILLTNEGVVKITDFGLSERREEGIGKEISDLGELAFELATGENLLDYGFG
jgi:serine/threonine protein kinase